MPRHRAILAWAIMAGVLAPLAAHASDGVDLPFSETVIGAQSPVGAYTFPRYPGTGLSLERRSPGLRLRLYPTPLALSDGGLRYGDAGRAASGVGLSLAPASLAPRAGWHAFGRVGPLRWTTPLDGEFETTLRLGPRLPGTPRLPGAIHFGISYAF